MSTAAGRELLQEQALRQLGETDRAGRAPGSSGRCSGTSGFTAARNRKLDAFRPAGPMRRKMRHFLETGSNRSMCRPIVSDGPRNRKPPSLRAKCKSAMTFFWTSGSR